ncbi:MAG: mercury methylation ferredoxin HgcB [Pelovirga sp.]
MNGFRYLKNVATLTLDRPACTGCGRCVDVCPHHVFVISKKAMITDRDACMECGACARNCPVNAISVAAGVGCAIGLFNEWLQERKLGKRSCC